MKVKPDERTKTIALAVGIVLVLVVFGFRVVPRLLPHGPQGQLLLGSRRAAATTTDWAAAAPTTAVAPTISAGNEPLAGSAAASIVVPPAVAADPFWRPLALSLQPDRLNALAARVPPAGLTKPAKFGAATGSGASAGSGPTQLAPVAPPPMPDVALQGIIQDQTAMAVLEIGGQTRFMKAGETLEGGWVLKSIHAATVTLRQGRREVVLMLGQTLPKDTPQENHDTRGLANTLPPFHSVSLAP